MLRRDLVHAAETIHSGGVIAYPTEAVFGLGCDPSNEAAVEKVLAFKQRPRDKGLILIAAEFTQLKPFIKPLDDATMRRLMNTWPGPVTWLMPAKARAPVWLRGRFDTLAVRVTAHPIATELCRRVGYAIVSTSANVTGQCPARSADAVRQTFGAAIDFVLDGPLGDSIRPTEIRDAISGEIIRAG
jgi:L-threonylcarbamoyladenylate synthase